jgi:HAD superfamily hydrolase (TIGR01509 family)
VVRVEPEAVVFDLDGVLVDSEAIWAAAEEATVTRLGGEYTPELRAALHGRGARDGGWIVAELLRRDDGDAIGKEVLDHALAALEREARPVDGADELVARLRGRIPIAVASNSSRELVETALRGAGLGEFDAIVAAEDVAAAKPAPDPYVEACRRLGVDPGRAAAVEDSPAGAASAKAAGMLVIGLDATGTVRLDAADIVVRSLRELTFANPQV